MIRILLAVTLLTPGLAAGQGGGVDGLETLLREGRYAAVRDSLDGWLTRRSELAPRERARALLLRARLRADPAAAESDYLAVILGHPATAEAAEALLRLGQALLASGDPSRAAGYLQRLSADYPGHPLRPVGLLWLSRARLAEGHRADACAAARDGLAVAGDDTELEALLTLERSATCRITAAAAPARQQPGDRPQEARRAEPAASAEPAEPAEDAASAEPGEGAAAAGEPEEGRGAEEEGEQAGAEAAPYAVQVGAFRSTARAQRMVSRLEESGYDARVVRVPDSSLVRVRIGRFGSVAGAESVRARIRRDGFDAVVVTDAAEERPAS